MSGLIKGEVAFYDAYREGCVAIVEASGASSRIALEQMAAALASVIVEKAPDEARRIWLGAGVDVRLRPARAVSPRAASARRWFCFDYFCDLATLAVIAAILVAGLLS